MTHDMIWDIWDGVDDSSSHMLCLKFLADPSRNLNDFVRSDLECHGWKFGRTIFSIHRCPCCPNPETISESEAKNIEARIALRTEAESLLEGDMDGMISTLSGIDVFMELNSDDA